MVSRIPDNGRKPYAMTALEYRVLKGTWGDDNHTLFVDLAERCYEEGWLDRAGQITPKGLLAVSLYETFRTEWPDEDWDDGDDVPWEGNSVLFLDSYRMSEAAAVPSVRVPDKLDVANDTSPLPIGARDPSYLAAPETEEHYG